MRIYSLENTKKDKKQNNLYDLIYPLLSYNNNPDDINEYIVKDDKEMRLDLICYEIYGTIIYMDELMHLNGIIDPYSVKSGDIIKWAPIDQLKRYRESYKDDETLRKNLKQVDDNNRKLTTSSPDNYVPVMIDKDNREIIITNKLK